MKFEELTLSPELLSGLQDANYSELTELQKLALPIIFDGKDALINTTDKRDKDVSYVVPALETTNNKEDQQGTSVLILTAGSTADVDKVFSSIGNHSQVQCVAINSDGAPESHQETLQSSADVVIANPAPLLEAMQELRYIFRNLDLLVIDTADEIIAQSLETAVKNITKRILCDYQTLIYSGDLNDSVQKLADRYLNEPVTVGTDGRAEPRILSKPPKVAPNLSHGYIYVPGRAKISTLMAHVESIGADRCVIFTASKRGTDRLYRILRKNNYKATSLHGKLSDEKRAQRFANFTNADIQFLLVADIPAAELDLRRVKQVINYDVPNDADEYRYRAGLVENGKATSLVSLVSKQDRNDINQLENELGQAPKELDLPDKVKREIEKRKKQEKQRKKRASKRKKQNKKRGKKPQKKKKELELPRPSFDKLSGGRTGEPKDAKAGVIGMLKKIFS